VVGRQVWQIHRRAQKLMARSADRLILHCGHINAAMAARRLKRRYQAPYLVWTHALEVMERNWNLPPVTHRSRDKFPDPVSEWVNRYVPINGPAISDLFELFDFGHK
jgi:hypothetical protein